MPGTNASRTTGPRKQQHDESILHAADLISAPHSPYDHHMNQPSQQHQTGPVTTDGQPHQQPPHPGYYPAPPQQNRRWTAIAIVAAIIVAGVLVAGAIMLSGTNKTQSPNAAPSTTAQAASVPTESTATCKAWRTTSAAFDAIPHLPDGWDWNTPNIDTLISNQKVAVDKALGIFESKIAANDPQQVVSAAHAYIGAKRTELDHLAAHTITEADGNAVDSSSATLNQLCT